MARAKSKQPRSRRPGATTEKPKTIEVPMPTGPPTVENMLKHAVEIAFESGTKEGIIAAVNQAHKFGLEQGKQMEKERFRKFAEVYDGG